jgi:hypothetical protein
MQIAQFSAFSRNHWTVTQPHQRHRSPGASRISVLLNVPGEQHVFPIRRDLAAIDVAPFLGIDEFAG